MPTQIKHELDFVYGDSAPSFTTVKFWAVDFKRGHKILENYERSGCPKIVTTDENITQVHQMVLYDHRIKERESRGYEHVKITYLSHIKSTFRHEKTVRALGVMFAPIRPRTCSNEHFQCSVGVINPSFCAD